MSEHAQYTEATRAGLQRIYGSGFTSPGGRPEMAALLDGLDITGMEVMDLGCGLGGDSLLLGGTFGAASVVSVDVDPGNLAVTGKAVEAAGLSGVIFPKLVEPGRFPFDDAAFDLVHSKAMICHVDDKEALFREIHRVLRPGGSFVAADWMAGDQAELSQSYRDFADDLATAGLIFFFKTAQTHNAALTSAGFEAVKLRDISPDIKNFAEQQLSMVTGSGRDDLISLLGDAGYAGMLRRSQARVDALASGDLQFQFMKATRGNG